MSRSSFLIPIAFAAIIAISQTTRAEKPRPEHRATFRTLLKALCDDVAAIEILDAR